MQLGSLSEILTCIKNWQNIRSNASALTLHLAKAKSFSYTVNNKASNDFHVYPGVTDTGTFYMFLISEAADREQDEDALYASITQCVVNHDLGNGEGIPEKVAKERIASWHEHCIDWIEYELKDGKELFQAFNLPASYMQDAESYRTFFALKDDEAQNKRLSADLVTTPVSTGITDAFYDFVRPVPPFDPLHFYLLHKAGQ